MFRQKQREQCLVNIYIHTDSEFRTFCFTSLLCRAGEGRVNEHPALTVMHTVFHRFHNRVALALSNINPRWSDETVRECV